MANTAEMQSGVTAPRQLSLDEMRASIARFDECINATMAAAPPTKEWVKRAIRRQGSDRPPVRMKRMSQDLILKYGQDLIDLFGEFPDDIAWILPYDYRVGYNADLAKRLDPLEMLTQERHWKDEWGADWGHATGGVGPHPMDPIMTDWSQLDDYIANNIPDPRAPGRMDAAIPWLDMHGRTKYCVGFIEGQLFERLGYVRGAEELFMSFHTDEGEIRKFAEAVLEYCLGIAKCWAEVAVPRGGDAVFLGDDWGTQGSLMISPDKWREIYKPYYKALFEGIHSHGLAVIWHSCGNIMQIIPDLIDIGLDVLDPVQPGPLDIEAVAREFGGHISFSGSLDVQQFIITSTPQQVKDAVRRTIDTLAKPFGNGLIVGPSNTMTPDVPFENLRAMFEACHGA